MLPRITFMLLRRFRTILSTLILGLVMVAPLSVNAVTINEFSTPTASSRPDGITAGPDGNLWFTENNGNNIGRITTTGVITEFAIGIPV